ncbi:MAG: putative S-adenosylmethionine-dependent methyltransferase [Pelotomaculum sp. PtaU1.Bin065]|nr:MAG: putative S-adenosylmethionine-dependent methyltransferase [Pelotomaculum sp. PtaU1.Bin065]
MKNPLPKLCPLCASYDTETIHVLDCGKFDRSKLYSTIRVNHCIHCGHIFNALSPSEFKGLDQYLNIEYAPANLNAVDIDGDASESKNNFSNDRYSQLYNILSPYIQYQHEILDVGCAMGGFLSYLSRKGFNRLSGVDMLEPFVESARQKKQFNIKLGNVESLPFADSTFDVIVMDQVFEHLAHPLKAFREIRRVLKKGGIFCLGVPDASRYSKFYFFDFYWLLLREHIQHFDVHHLNLAANKEGFQIEEHRKTAHAVMSEQMVMPNLNIIFRLSGSVSNKNIKVFKDNRLFKQMSAYIRTEKTRQLMNSRSIEKLVQLKKPVFVWGIGREFFYLYESVGLKYCNIAGLIDGNYFKQQSCRIHGMKIRGADELLQKASSDATLLITAIAHAGPIRKKALAMGFKGEILDLKNSTV